jgi:iron complex outermembrane receptor protein
MKIKYILSMVLSMLIYSNAALSQTDYNPVELDEIVLSIPFGQTLGKSVIKVDKINLNDINPIIKQYISKSISRLPGVSIITTGPGIAKPSIRGLSFNRVLVYSQGVRLENQQWGEEHGIGISSSGSESVEVVKGPLYVLYGSDAMGGVIYVEPEKYKLSDGQDIDFTSIYNSNYNGFTNNLGINGKSGNFSYLLRADIIENGEFSSPNKEIENSWFSQNDFKSGLSYNSEKLSSDLRYSLTNSSIGIPMIHDESEEEHDEGEHEEGEFQELNHSILTWNNTFDMGNNHILNFTLGHQVNQRKEFGAHEEDEDHADEDHDEDHYEHMDEEEAELDMKLITTTLNAKLTMPQSEDFNLVMGINLLDQENTNFGHEELIPDSQMNDFGLFALGQLNISSNNQALIGVRYDSRSISSNNISNDYSRFNGSIGIKSNFSNSILRVNLSSGFRAPSLIELFADGVHHGSFQYKKGNTNLNAETSLQADLSLQINNENSLISFDLFYNNINDYIYLNPSLIFADGYRVYDYLQQDAVLYGGEFHLNKKTNLNWLKYYSSIEYIFGETSDKEALPFISPLTFNQVFNIDFSNDYSLEIDFIAKAKQGRVSNYEEKTSGYSLLNLSGNWKTTFLENDLNIFWTVNNVFDKEYYDHLSRLKNAGIYEMGRNLSIGLKYNF